MLQDCKLQNTILECNPWFYNRFLIKWIGLVWFGVGITNVRLRFRWTLVIQSFRDSGSCIRSCLVHWFRRNWQKPSWLYLTLPLTFDPYSNTLENPAAYWISINMPALSWISIFKSLHHVMSLPLSLLVACQSPASTSTVALGTVKRIAAYFRGCSESEAWTILGLGIWKTHAHVTRL